MSELNLVLQYFNYKNLFLDRKYLVPPDFFSITKLVSLEILNVTPSQSVMILLFSSLPFKSSVLSGIFIGM